MVRPRDKPRKIGKTSGDDMAAAIKLVTEQNLSIREAARTSGIPLQTLHRYVKKAQLHPGTEIRTQPHYEVRQIFSREQEADLGEYLQICSKMAYGLSTVALRKLAYDMAKENNIQMPQSWEEKKLLAKNG